MPSAAAVTSPTLTAALSELGCRELYTDRKRWEKGVVRCHRQNARQPEPVHAAVTVAVPTNSQLQLVRLMSRCQHAVVRWSVTVRHRRGCAVTGVHLTAPICCQDRLCSLLGRGAVQVLDSSMMGFHGCRHRMYERGCGAEEAAGSVRVCSADGDMQWAACVALSMSRALSPASLSASIVFSSHTLQRSERWEVSRR